MPRDTSPRDRSAELNELRHGLEHGLKPSEVSPVDDEGDWVLLGVLQLRLPGDRMAVPVMEPKRRMWMQRYMTKEMAIDASCDHSSTRVGGGWVLNLLTGETHQVPATHSVEPPC